MNKFHYVYRITNIKLKKHYYGVRTSKVEPKLDIGINYFSSSSDKAFIKDQIDNKQNYKYKILKMFNDRSSANALEVKLHKKFNVGTNESFYNLMTQGHTAIIGNAAACIKGIKTKRNKMCTNGKTILENSIEKGKQTCIDNGWYSTLSIEQSNRQNFIHIDGKTEAQHRRAKQYTKQINDIDINGLNAAQRAGITYHKNIKETIDEATGLTKAELRIIKQKETIKLNGTHNGSKNNNFGKSWVFNDLLKESKPIKRELIPTYLNEGWELGMKRDYCKSK